MSLSFPANELWSNSEPVCPYCKAVQDISDDRPSDGDFRITECDNCEKKFCRSTIISVDYSTVGDCEANGELPHELVLTSSHVQEFTCKKCRGTVYDWQFPNGRHPKLKEGEFIIL